LSGFLRLFNQNCTVLFSLALRFPTLLLLLPSGFFLLSGSFALYLTLLLKFALSFFFILPSN